MMTDPIADMLTRIRNGSAAKNTGVIIPFSKIKLAIAHILEREGYLKKVEVLKENYGQIKVGLKYKDKSSVIESIKRISKPGQRIYAKKDHLPKVLNGLGIAILSTSEGIMTNKEAKKRGLGGEIICEIY